MPLRRSTLRFGRRPAGHLLLTVFALMSLLLVAPVPGRAADAGPAVHSPSDAGVFTVAGPGYDAAILDPALATDSASLTIASQLYDTLVMYRDGGSLPIPGLAQSWQVSEDELTWTFHLRSGVSFHDGTPVDAAAVVANIRRWWDPADPNHQGDFVYFGALFFGFRGDSQCLITSVSAASSQDVVIGLRTPHGAISAILAFPAFGIASPAALAGGALATSPVGSGPFRFVERVAGERVVLAANADYWGGAPRSESLVFRAMSSAADRLAGLQAGDVQAAEGVWPAAGDPLVRTLARPSLNLGYLGINRSRGPLGNPLVRLAIAHSVDKAHVAAANPGVMAADQFLPTGIWGRDPDIDDYWFDPELARLLLLQAGHPDGFTTTLSYRTVYRGYMSEPVATAQAIKADLALAGITVELEEVASGELIARVESGDVDLFLLGWSADYPHPFNFFFPILCLNDGGFQPRDEELCTAAAGTLSSGDMAAQMANARWASRRVHDALPLIPLLNGSSSLAVRCDVTGVIPSPIGTESYRLAETIPQGPTTVNPGEDGAVGFLEGAAFRSLQVPAGSVTQPTVLRFSSADVGTAPPELLPAGPAFDIDPSQGGQPLTDLVLARPATLTVEYTEAVISGLDEATLALYTWDGAGWVDATKSCISPPRPVIDPVANRISAQICHLSRFALFGEPLQIIRMPLARR